MEERPKPELDDVREAMREHDRRVEDEPPRDPPDEAGTGDESDDGRPQQ
jgi:hypothetical protein